MKKEIFLFFFFKSLLIKSYLCYFGIQTVEMEIDGDEYIGLPFVLHSDGYWIKNSGSDFYVDFSDGPAKPKKV